jgi:hypothetical protein
LSIFVALHHVTHYKYDRPIDLGPQTIRLRPAPHTRTPILSYSLKVTPANHFVNWQQDPQGNWLARFVFPGEGDRAQDRGRFHGRDDRDQSVRLLRRALCRQFSVRLSRTISRRARAVSGDHEPAGRCSRNISAGIPARSPSTVNFLVDLNARCSARSATSSAWSRACRRRRRRWRRAGSCRDSAWLLIQILRHLGLAARFVSGYLIQLRPDIDPVEGRAGRERFHRPARLGRGLSAGRRLDRLRRRPRAC